ncbi:hypothetical protein RQ479_07945 [Mesorhizobium sp. ISC25]|uniref:hypothetical protein n=1 Tax=Mesorhizobium sp. ISC25 TaxID=3077335 RepID=UPI0035E20A95
MIFGMSVEQIIPFANFVGLGLLGILAAFGLRFGRSNATPGERQLEIAGALVDSAAVKQLASAIEAHTLETVACRLDAEKARQAMYRMIEVGNRIVDELGDMRREVGDLGKEIARSK